MSYKPAVRNTSWKPSRNSTIAMETTTGSSCTIAENTLLSIDPVLLILALTTSYISSGTDREAANRIAHINGIPSRSLTPWPATTVLGTKDTTYKVVALFLATSLYIG